MSDFEKSTFGKWQNALISLDPKHAHDVSFAAQFILDHWSRYQAVALEMNMPPWVLGCIHARESSFSFERHLHNGDPLSARTVHVPLGRPVDGQPPFLWEESAADALSLRGWNKFQSWDVVSALVRMEAWNGLGYKNKNLPSPYIWSFTNQYASGKFVADGKFDPKAIDGQPGCAAIMLQLKRQGIDLKEIYPT